MARFRKWNAAKNWNHPRGPGGKFRSTGGVKRRRRPKVSRSQLAAGARVLGKNDFARTAVRSALSTQNAVNVISASRRASNPVLATVGGARLATTAAGFANEVHNQRRTVGKNRLRGQALAKHRQGYEVRKRHIGRAHRVTGAAMTATSVIGTAHYLANHPGTRTLAGAVRTRKAWNANAASRGIPRTGVKLAGVKPNRKGVYNITTAKKPRR